MSKNRTRAFLKNAQTNREYKLRLIRDLYPLYWDEGLNFKKGHSSDKYRSYKTWKHSRKTKYKMKKIIS